VLSASSPAEPVRPVRPAGPAGPIPRKSVTGMPVVGMVGGGQLARMTAQAAIGLGARFRVLAGAPSESAAQVTHDVVVGSHLSLPDVAAFAAGCDVLTFDHEHVPGSVLTSLESSGVLVRPGSAALWYTQDKLAMRERLTSLGAPCPRYAPVSSVADVEAFAASGGGTWPVVLKAVSGGYDGKGVWICSSPAEAAEVLGHGIALLAEEFVPFRRELAALVARSPSGQGAAYPIVQTVQVDGICREVIAPAPGLDPEVAASASALALRISAALGVLGLLAVELFETPSGGLLVNELAMRPHNSGHWTIEGARTSQFEQHLRAVLDLPLGSVAPSGAFAVMANLLGGTDPDVYDRYIHVMAADPAVKVHFYGKEVRLGRKIGHVTIVAEPGDEVEAVRDRARRAASYLRWGTEDGD